MNDRQITVQVETRTGLHIGDDGCRSSSSKSSHETRQANSPCSGDEHCVAQADSRAAHCVDADGQRLAHGTLFETDGIRQREG